MNLSNEDVQDILALLDSLPYDDLTLETSRFSLRLRRADGGVWAQESQVLAEPVPVGPAGAAPAAGDPAVDPGPGADPHPPPAASQDPPPAEGLLEVRAPLPGTFYRAPQPGAPPFVEIGSQVAGETVVAIVETMKLMNPVYAGACGAVAEIHLADGEFAPPGTVLMRLRPQAG